MRTLEQQAAVTVTEDCHSVVQSKSGTGAGAIPEVQI